MSQKKRKSTVEDGERASKKQQLGSDVRVKHIRGPDVAKPIIASSPGVSFPDVNFQCFAKPGGNGSTSLLLRSSDRPTITYTAREDESSAGAHLKHYIAVFDPQTSRLKVTEAKQLTVRSVVQVATRARDGQDGESANNPVSNYSSRTALTTAFGTKKSKKAVQSMTENRLLAQGNENADNPVSAAILSKVDDQEEISQEALKSEAQRNKPLPPANLVTNEIDQVYPYAVLVYPGPATETLKAMPIQTWLARVQAGKDVMTRSRFVANRISYLVRYLVQPGNEEDPTLLTAIRVLRYIQLLLDLHTYTNRLPRRRVLPPIDKWPDKTMSDGTPFSLLRPIISHFFPDRTPKEQSVTLLRTTILALTLHVPPPSLKHGVGVLSTEPTDISMDLALEASDARKLYRELGCRLAPAAERDLNTWGLEKLAKAKKDKDGNKTVKLTFAKLHFPLDFPKLGQGRAMGRR